MNSSDKVAYLKDNNNIMDDIRVPEKDLPLCLNFVKYIAKEIYLLSPGHIKRLNGYDDQNFEIYCTHFQSKFVLKVTNRTESQNSNFIEAQNALMFHLNPHFPVPVPFSNPNRIKTEFNKENLYYVFIKVNEFDQRIVRLLRYQEGSPLANCHIPNPKSILFFNVGRTVATLNDLMKDFYHPGYTNRHSIWQLEKMPNIKFYIGKIVLQNVEKQIVEDVIKEFEEIVLNNVYTQLDKQIIHGDLNEQNILLKPFEEYLQIASIIDFADSHYSCTIFDLIIASAYMAVNTKSIETIAFVLAGFQSIKPLSQIEKSIIKICIEARLCQSLILGLYAYERNPSNKYVLSIQNNGWLVLKMIRYMNDFNFHMNL